MYWKNGTRKEKSQPGDIIGDNNDIYGEDHHENLIHPSWNQLWEAPIRWNRKLRPWTN